MNRKRKHNELYKGVFKNDKKSCLIDLRPKEEKKSAVVEKENENINIPRQKKTLDLNLRVAKNFKFGSYFENLREEIVDIFTQEDEYISFEGLFMYNKMNDLFNFQESTEPVNNQTTENRTYYEEEILYEDENETIVKRKKTVEKLRDRMTMERSNHNVTNVTSIEDESFLNKIFKMPENRYKYN
jgi:hypothetical protein